MADNEKRTMIDETRATGASKEGVVRWVLVIGTGLAIILLSLIWITGAAFQGDEEEAMTANGNLAAEDRGDGTDSIIGDGEGQNLGTGSDDTTMENSLEVVENNPEPQDMQ